MKKQFNDHVAVLEAKEEKDQELPDLRPIKEEINDFDKEAVLNSISEREMSGCRGYGLKESKWP